METPDGKREDEGARCRPREGDGSGGARVGRPGWWFFGGDGQRRSTNAPPKAAPVHDARGGGANTALTAEASNERGGARNGEARELHRGGLHGVSPGLSGVSETTRDPAWPPRGPWRAALWRRRAGR